MQIIWAIILMLSFFASASAEENWVQIGGIRFEVEVRGKHPSLQDHQKQLSLKTTHGIKKYLPLYPDPGAGSPVHLFTSPDKTGVIVIDSNGTWIQIAAASGAVMSVEWCWNEAPPNDWVASFAYIPSQIVYQANRTHKPSIEDIYKYKDPDSPVDAIKVTE